MSQEQFPLVDVSGTPYERGVMHGAAVPGRVARSIALYREQLARRGIADADVKRLALAMQPMIAAFDPDYLQEMRGIADGADVALEGVIIVNCRTEMMFGHEQIMNLGTALDDGCTGLVVLPAASASGRLMHAHNWDWREECVDTGIVLRVQRTDGPNVLCFTEAGSLARHGLNSVGVSLTGNFLTSNVDYLEPADVPLVLIRRKMLESSSIAAAMRVLWGSRRFCSNNMMVAQAEGEAFSLECAPNEIFVLEPTADILVHANHWVTDAARVKLEDRGLLTSPDSLYRHRRTAAALAKAAGRIDWDVVKTILSDEFGKPDSVLRSPRAVAFDSISCTVATTLMDPTDGAMWIARKPFESREFVEYRL
jgi:isopenicillin-N N-acyltransferase like protein